MNLSGIAYASFGRMIVISARARVHRGNQHEACRIVEAVFGSRDGYVSVFQGLAKHFENASIELWEFIKEKQAVMSEANFTRLRVRSSSHHCDLGYRMVR